MLIHSIIYERTLLAPALFKMRHMTVVIYSYSNMIKRLLLLCSIVCTFLSCTKEIDFDDNTPITIDGTDSLKFGSVIADTKSETQRTVIYNHSKKNIHIESIRLEKGKLSPFSFNADGETNTENTVYNLELLRHDSLFIFCFIKSNNILQKEPLEQTDRLLITTKAGVKKAITLQAFTQGVKTLHSLHVNTDTTLTADIPFHIIDSIEVGKNGILRIMPGTNLYFHSKAKLNVKGRILAKGTLEAPIVMQCDKLGNIFSTTPYTSIPGLWGGVDIQSESFDNELQYVDIKGGSFGIKCHNTTFDTRQKLKIYNCRIHNTQGDNLYARNANIDVRNTQISNAKRNCVRIEGGRALFVHATIAQFYPFAGGHGPALYFSNYDDTSTTEDIYPLHALNCYNTIITGTSADDLMGHPCINEEIPFNCLFDHCLLNTPKANDDEQHYHNCYWEEDNDKDIHAADNFTPPFDYKALSFSYMLSDKSQAIGNANKEMSKRYAPTDFYHISRLSESDDIGCYQYQPAEDNKKELHHDR